MNVFTRYKNDNQFFGKPSGENCIDDRITMLQPHCPAGVSARKAQTGVLVKIVVAVLLTMTTAFVATACGGGTAKKDAPNEQSVSMRADGSTSATQQQLKPLSLDKTVRVNEATLVIRLRRTYPEGAVGASTIEEVIRSLFATRFKPDFYDTVTVTDFLVAPVKGRPNVFVAAVKTLGEGRDAVEQKIDIFAFQNSDPNNSDPNNNLSNNQSNNPKTAPTQASRKFLLAYASLEPDYDDFELEQFSAEAHQITQAGEFAVSLEYTGLSQGLNHDQARMLHLFRLHTPDASDQSGLEPIFEYCIRNKTGESPDATGLYQVQITTESSVVTQRKWNHELYSIIIVKTETRKGDAAVGARTAQTIKTRSYFDWEQGKYSETLQQDLGRTTSYIPQQRGGLYSAHRF